MNYLAHCFLSCSEEDLLIGNFIADSIRNRDLAALSEGVRAGVMLHRKIDSFTDRHPLTRAGTARLHARHGKYAGVIIDIFYDYLLVKNWARYSAEDLGKWTQKVYRLLEKRSDDLPPGLRRNVPYMIRDNWLMRYGTEAGLRFTFDRMKVRVKYPALFAGATDSLLMNLAAFNRDFNLFFPEVVDFTEGECGC